MRLTQGFYAKIVIVNYLTLINQLYSIEKVMDEKELILVYKDDISPQSLDRILALTEFKINTLIEDRSYKKKMFNVLVEAVQNILKHGDRDPRLAVNYKSMLIIGKEKQGFFIITGNVLKKSKMLDLVTRLDNINGLNEVELRQLYNQTIQNNPFSEKGGAGLGLIDMARKTGNKISYAMKELDPEHYYVSLKTLFCKTDSMPMC